MSGRWKTKLERNENRNWIQGVGLCIGALLGCWAPQGPRSPFAAIEAGWGRRGCAVKGEQRRRWRGPQAKPRTRAPQRPLTGGAHAEARQAADGGAQVAGTATGEMKSRESAGTGRRPDAHAQRACEWKIERGRSPLLPSATSAHARPSSRWRCRRRSGDRAPARPPARARS